MGLFDIFRRHKKETLASDHAASTSLTTAAATSASTTVAASLSASGSTSQQASAASASTEQSSSVSQSTSSLSTSVSQRWLHLVNHRCQLVRAALRVLVRQLA